MGFFSDFFGGKKATQGEAIDLAPSEFKATRGVTGGALTDFLTDQPTFEGPFGAPLGDDEKNLSLQAVKQAQTPFAGRDALVNTLNEGVGANPFLAANIEGAQRPILEKFETDRESLRGAFAKAGQRVGGRRGSSQFQKTLARTGRAASQKLASAAQQISSADFERRRDTQHKAIATAIGVEQAEISRVSQALEAAGVEREVLDTALARAADQNIKGLEQLLNAIRIGGAAGKATIVHLAGVAPGDGALSDIASLVGGFFAGPAGAQAGQALGQSVESAAR